MASRENRAFSATLEELFNARFGHLKRSIWPAKGRFQNFTKTLVENSILHLQDLVADAMIHSGTVKQTIRKTYDYKKQWQTRGKGRGVDAKRRNFKAWYSRNISTLNCVYEIWGRSGALYVGRTLNGKGRPTNHFEKHWFMRATRVDVYGFDRKRDVPRFECFLTHRDRPTYSKITPGSKKYYTACPICEKQREIRAEVKSVFRLR